MGSTDRLEKITDKKSLTYITHRDLNIIFKSEGKATSGFEIQARNDDNHINIGEEYELLVFDKGWKSVRREIANDTVLCYDNLKQKALYILKNHTKGKEENVFCFDDHGTQFWFGVSDINQIMERFESDN